MLPYSPQIVAEAIHAHLDAATAARGQALLAIPGARMPGPILTALAGMMDDFVRARLHLLWLDERAVPRGHADRNDGQTLAAWQAGGALPAHVHAMPAEEADLEAASASYAATLRGVAADGVIDCCLVGFGEDGHMASLFPHHPALKEVVDVLAIYDSPKPPPRRLTVSLACLHRARAHIVVAQGAAKGLVLAKARAGADPGLPVSLLPAARTTWYADDAAAAAAGAPTPRS